MSRYLDTYTPTLSILCSIGALDLFSRGVSSLDAFRTYPVVRSCSTCLIRQPMYQRHRTIVPLVLNDPSSQILNMSSRYHTNCLTTFLTQLTNRFNR